MDLRSENSTTYSAPKKKSLAGMKKGRDFDLPAKDFLSDCGDRIPIKVESVAQDAPVQLPP